MRMSGFSVTAVGVLALALVATVPAVAAPSADTALVMAAGRTSAAELASSFWPNVRGSAGPVLAEVDLVDRAGRPMPEAEVVASLWPTQEATSAMKSGDTFSVTPIDRKATSAGRARIQSDDPALLAAHTSKDGTLLVLLDVYLPDGEATTVFVERVQRGGRWVTSSVAATEVTNPERPVKFVVEDTAVAKVRTVREHDPHEHRVEPRSHQGSSGCSGLTYVTPTTAYTTTATAAVYRGIRAKGKYTSTASTTNGLGVSADAGANWSQSGKSTKTSTLTASYNTITGSSTAWTNKEWRATWAHKRAWRHCWDPCMCKTYEQRFTFPDKVAGFPSIINSRYSLPSCVNKVGLSGVKTVSTESATAATYSNGFSLKYGVGTFSGTTQSGYTTAVKMTFERPEVSGYWYWCGDTFNPVDARRVRAGR